MNLLKETIEDIKISGHTVKDITFIGSQKSGYQCSWEEFKILADYDYDCGFGASEVATDLIIVFSDRQIMRRGEYDGSEWWVYCIPFEKPKEIKKLKSVFINENQIGWRTLEEIDKEK